MKCYSCKEEVSLDGNVARGDECPHCTADLKVCMNCSFYDSNYNNECRETQAERVIDKEKANFCDYFKIKENNKSIEDNAKEKALEELNKLFK